MDAPTERHEHEREATDFFRRACRPTLSKHYGRPTMNQGGGGNVRDKWVCEGRDTKAGPWLFACRSASELRVSGGRIYEREFYFLFLSPQQSEAKRNKKEEK